MSLKDLNELAKASKPKPRLSALIAGRPSTGKTHLILTAPRPCVVLYCDRAGGDSDLEEVDGVFRIYLRRGDVVKTACNWLERIAAGDLSKEGIQTIALDSLSYLQSLVQADMVSGDKMASQRDFGRMVQGMEKILTNFLTMDQHRLINCHLKSKTEAVRIDGEEQRLTVWMPDAMPKVREIVMREVGLMGYTWRRSGAGGDDTFGVNFTEEARSRGQVFQFQDAKAPAGWGANEPSDIAAWIARLWPEKPKATVTATTTAAPLDKAPKP
jgi:hypothetical protein